jgi:LPXTG-motif cell wall-anchored protein
MRRADQKPRRRRIAWIVASLACAVAAVLTVAPAGNAQQGSAQDQYKLNLPSATGSDQREVPAPSTAAAAAGPPSPAAAHRLAGTGGDDTGLVVAVLGVGLAAISVAGGFVAYRRRQTAAQNQ